MTGWRAARGGGLCKSCRAKVDAMEAQYEMGKELA